MKREFLFNIILLVFINLLIKPVFIFGIDLGVQNQLGEQYGLYFALLNLSYLTQIVNDFGIQSFNNRHISQHPHLLPKYFPNLLAIKGLLSLTYVLLTLLIAWWGLGYDYSVMPLLLVLLLNQVLVQMILFLRSNVSGLGFYRLDSVLSSLDKLLMLGTCGAVLWGKVVPLTLMSFAFSQTIALLVTLVVVYVVLRRLTVLPLRPSWSKNWRAGRPALLMLFRQSMPYALVVLLMFAYSRMDAVILERMAGEAQADIFAGAFRLLDACNMFGYLFASLLLPMFARLMKQHEPLRPLVSLSFKLIWAGSITLSAAIFFFRAELLQWMMPHRALEARFDVLGVLIWAFVPISVTHIFSTLLTARERLMEMNRYFLMAVALDVGLNLFLIPEYQSLGAAVAALSTQAFIAVAMVWLSFKEFKFSVSIAGLIRIALYAAFVLGATWAWHGQNFGSWGVRLLLSLASGLLGLLLTGLIDLKQIRQALKSL